MGTPPDLRQKKSKKKTKMLTVLLPLALIAIAFADHHKEVDPLHYQVDITSEDSSYNFGVDDDDTDKSDEAGRRAWNRANNVAQMIQNKIEKAHNECDYWPRKDNERCLRAVTACILEPLTLIGELKRHMNLISERCDELNLGNNKGAKAAIKSAKLSAVLKMMLAKTMLNAKSLLMLLTFTVTTLNFKLVTSNVKIMKPRTLMNLRPRKLAKTNFKK